MHTHVHAHAHECPDTQLVRNCAHRRTWPLSSSQGQLQLKSFLPLPSLGYATRSQFSFWSHTIWILDLNPAQGAEMNKAGLIPASHRHHCPSAEWILSV